MESNSFISMAKTAAVSQQRVFAIVVVAAGSGSRLGYGMPKAQVLVAEKEILRWALEGVVASGLASRLIVTVPVGDTVLSAIAEEFGALAVTGGQTRAESVVAALGAISDAPIQAGMSAQEPNSVLVHDCARCFTPVEAFLNVSEALEQGEKAVIPVVPVIDTIKTVDEGEYVTGTPARSHLRAVQTPQGFDLPTLLEAYEKASEQGLAESITDDAMLAETMNIPVLCVAGSPDSFKVTTPLDLALARALYENPAS